MIVPSPALIVPWPALIVPLPVNRFPNKLAPNVPNNMYLIVLLIPFLNKLDSSRDLTIFTITFMISFKSSFENTNVVVTSPNTFLWTAASVADAAVC